MADSGGATIPRPPKVKKKTAPPAAKRPSGGVPAGGNGRPEIADVRCATNPGGPCVDSHRGERGGTVTLTGRNLQTITQLVFYGAKGAADDALTPVTPATSGRLSASVPPQAQTGPVAVIDGSGKRSKRWVGLVLESADRLGLRPASAVPSVQVSLSEPRTIFFGGMQKAVYNFRVSGGGPVDVRVDLVRLTDGTVVRSWQRPGTAPGVTQRIAWNGAVHGRPLAQGRYGFSVSVPGALGARAQPAPDQQDAVTLIGYQFPIRGRHQFNLSAGRFGAGRRGHTHQGQDVFAACGTPLVAARGGTVVYSGFHSLAGYYVVIDGKGTGTDYAYMHLREPALVGTGATVSTGQQIGEVGDTGDAQGCHLHFEEWTAPGWYKGGHPFDPLPDLKRWDVPVQ